MDKKSQGISINTIIIAAIALIVLVVLIAIFTGKIGGFTAGVTDTSELSCDKKCKSIGFKSGSESGSGSQTSTTKNSKTIPCYCSNTQNVK